MSINASSESSKTNDVVSSLGGDENGDNNVDSSNLCCDELSIRIHHANE